MNDLNNYKGIYFGADNEKYTCPVTGAHFRFTDLCNRLEPVRLLREQLFAPKQNTAQNFLNFVVKPKQPKFHESENFWEDTINEHENAFQLEAQTSQKEKALEKVRKKKLIPNSKGLEKCKSVKEITVKRRQFAGVSRNTHEPELMKTYSTANLRNKLS